MSFRKSFQLLFIFSVLACSSKDDLPLPSSSSHMEHFGFTLEDTFWPSGFDQDSAIGARNIPDAVKREYMRIGREITSE